MDFSWITPEYLLFFRQVRGVMPPDVDIAKELWDIYDGHLRRLAHLVESVSEGIGSTRDMGTTFAAYTSGVLTSHVHFEGAAGIKHRRDYFLQAHQQSIQPLLKNGCGFR